MMAIALVELITQDHTLESGGPPFAEYLVQVRLDPFAGGEGWLDHPPASPPARLDVRALTGLERDVVESALASYGPVRWIQDPNLFNGELGAGAAAVLGVGEPTLVDGVGEVPVSLVCGNACGHWLTYRLEFVDGSWRVTGTTGVATIS